MRTIRTPKRTLVAGVVSVSLAVLGSVSTAQATHVQVKGSVLGSFSPVCGYSAQCTAFRQQSCSPSLATADGLDASIVNVAAHRNKTGPVTLTGVSLSTPSIGAEVHFLNAACAFLVQGRAVVNGSSLTIPSTATWMIVQPILLRVNVTWVLRFNH